MDIGKVGTDMDVVGERIAEVLRYRGMSQKELARRSGVTEAAVSRYIAGNRAPRAATLARIAKALGTTCDELLGLAPPPSAGELDAAVLLVSENAGVLSDKQREMLIRALSTR